MLVGRPVGLPKSGGRAKGTPNRKTQEVANKLYELGCDPIEGMARIAMDNTQPTELRVRCYAELAVYMYPKRKAVEHTYPADDPPFLFVVQAVSADQKLPMSAPDRDEFLTD